MLIVSAREFSQLNANRLFNGNMCPIAFRSARGNSRVDCFGFGGCLSLPLPRSGEGVWSLWFDAHAGGLADVSLTQVPQPPRSPPAWLRLQICGSVWLGAFAPHLLESKRCTRAHRHYRHADFPIQLSFCCQHFRISLTAAEPEHRCAQY